MKSLYFSMLILISVWGSSCKPSTDKVNRNGIFIVCTTGIIADVVRNIVGEKAIVHSLMGAGVDPHLYKATQGDIEKLEKADIIFYNGLHLEGKMVDVLERLAKRRNVIAVTDAVPKSALRTSPQFKDAFDPHVWFDPILWSYTTEIILKTVSDSYPADSAYYRKNARDYAFRLNKLFEEASGVLESIPAKERVLITAHDAFYYFGNRFNFEVRGLQGISTISEFGLKDVTELVDYISDNKIKSIFIESSVPPRNLEAIIKGCEAKGHHIKIGGTLYSDALGETGTPEGTYIGMFRANINTIKNALK